MAEKKVVARVDFDALVGMQKANIDTMVEVRNIMMDAVQTVMKLQYGWYEHSLQQAEKLFKGDVAERKPEDFFAEVKAVTENAVAVGKEQTDLGMKAQKQVAELVASRLQKNFEDVKTLAA